MDPTTTTAPPPAIPTIDTLDVDAYVELVGAASKAEMKDGIAANRDAILDLIFAAMERRYRGGPELSLVVHWEIIDRADGGVDLFEMVIADGRALSTRTPQRAPDVHLRIRPIDFVRLATGHVSGGGLFARRRLRATGDVKLAARIPSLFEIPGKRR